MSVGGGLKDGLRAGSGTAWAVAKRAAVKVAIAAAIVVVVMAMVERGEGSAAGPASFSESGQAGPVSAQPAILSEERAGEQLLLCRYEVDALFGVSIFADTTMTAKRLVRIPDGEELRGSCFAREGDKALSCDGLAWDYEWIRVRSGSTLGWSPATCLERIGFF
ncbi:hypothetical protein GCM10027447_33960 [Glycomyces halotolerans]